MFAFSSRRSKLWVGPEFDPFPNTLERERGRLEFFWMGIRFLTSFLLHGHDIFIVGFVVKKLQFVGLKWCDALLGYFSV